MKTSLASTTLAVLVAVSFIAAGPSAAAMPRLSRERCGVIERIDRETRTLVIRLETGKEPLEVVWKKRTKFVRNGKFEFAALPEKGRHVCVRYRSPFFGDKFATRVFWNNGTAPGQHEEQKPSSIPNSCSWTTDTT